MFDKAILCRLYVNICQQTCKEDAKDDWKWWEMSAPPTLHKGFGRLYLFTLTEERTTWRASWIAVWNTEMPWVIYL